MSGDQMGAIDFAFRYACYRLSPEIMGCLNQCEKKVSYRGIKRKRNTPREYLRIIDLISPHPEVFEALSLELVIICTQMNAVMGDTAINLFLNREIFENYERQKDYPLKIQNNFLVKSELFSICCDSARSVYFVSHQKWLDTYSASTTEKRIIWAKVLQQLQPESLPAGINCYCELIKFDGQEAVLKIRNIKLINNLTPYLPILENAFQQVTGERVKIVFESWDE